MSNWARPRGNLDWQSMDTRSISQDIYARENKRWDGREKHRAETGSAEGGTRLAGD